MQTCALDSLFQAITEPGTERFTAVCSGRQGCWLGRFYLHALVAAGQVGVAWALGFMQAEIERDMKLMGVSSISEVSRANLCFR